MSFFQVDGFYWNLRDCDRLGILPANHQSSPRDYLEAHEQLCPRTLSSFLFKVVTVLSFARTVMANSAGRSDEQGAFPWIDSPFQTLLIPLPPLAEQHRIVAKVDELMALCDRLEVARAEREATRDRLATASLARLNAPDPTDPFGV